MNSDKSTGETPVGRMARMAMPRSSDVVLATALCVAICSFLAGCQKDVDGYSDRLSMSKPQPASMAVSPDPDERAKAIVSWSKNSWGRTGPYYKYYLMAAASDESPIVRSAAARALGLCGDPSAVATLAQAMTDSSPVVRGDAAVALDAVPGWAAVEPLLAAAKKDPATDVRISAITALRHYPRTDVLLALANLMADRPFGVSYQAHASLVQMTGQDLGTDPGAWVDVVKDPARHIKPPSRPWWDARKPMPLPAAPPPASQPAQTK